MKDVLPYLFLGFIFGTLCGTCVTMALKQEELNRMQREALERGYASFILPDESSRAQFTWRRP